MPLDILLCLFVGQGALGSQAGWVDLEVGHKTHTDMGQLQWLSWKGR